MTIIFYDIPSSTPENAWSPNTWKVRYSLNYKGLPYKTEWIEFPDIEARCKELGIPYTSLKQDGSPKYSLPALHDPSTGVYIADSFPIAEYLEKTYPNLPSLFPHNTIGLQAPFDNAVRAEALSPLWNFIIPQVYLRLNPASQGYFRTTREAGFGKALEDVPPKGDAAVTEWAAFKEGLGTIDSWYKRSGGPFILGSTVSWADFIIGSWIIWMRAVFGEKSEKWKDIASWHDGRWATVLGDLKKYQAIV